MPESPEPESPRTRWEDLSSRKSGADYDAHFEALAAQGRDTHGEASFCAALLAPGARILDAGCGTGRVAIRLGELGFHVVGVDVDESMLAVAREKGPAVPWHRADLAGLTLRDLGEAEPFDLVVMAGNVVPLLGHGTLPDAVGSMARLLRAGGLLVAGFGLDPDHLPPGCPVTPLEEYDEACTDAGLEPVERFATWDRDPYDPATGYAVSVHRLPDRSHPL